MAIIKCKECGNDVSNKAVKCPHCGCPVEDKGKIILNAIKSVCVIALTIFLIHACDSTDEEKKLADTDLVTCDFDTMINNPVQAQSAQELVDECHILSKYLGAQPTYKLLKETGIANSAFQMKGYKQDAAYTTERLLQISELRGQIRKGDEAIINNYNIAFKLYSAWDGDVTPDTIYGFLTHTGPLSKTLSDDGLVGAMASTR